MTLQSIHLQDLIGQILQSMWTSLPISVTLLTFIKVREINCNLFSSPFYPRVLSPYVAMEKTKPLFHFLF